MKKIITVVLIILSFTVGNLIMSYYQLTTPEERMVKKYKGSCPTEQDLLTIERNRESFTYTLDGLVEYEFFELGTYCIPTYIQGVITPEDFIVKQGENATIIIQKPRFDITEHSYEVEEYRKPSMSMTLDFGYDINLLYLSFDLTIGDGNAMLFDYIDLTLDLSDNESHQEFVEWANELRNS